MFGKIKEIEDRFDQLEIELARPETIRDQKLYQKYVKEHSSLSPMITAYRKYTSIEEEMGNSRTLLEDPDPEIKKLAREEIDSLKAELARLEAELKLLLLPKDPNDEKNIILEIRAGTGGEEAALFAADLFRMYTRFAEKKGWKYEVLSLSPSELKGFKEIIFSIKGKDIYKFLRFEKGVHRFQGFRSPFTKSLGQWFDRIRAAGNVLFSVGLHQPPT